MKRDKTKPLSYRVRYTGKQIGGKHRFVTIAKDRADEHEFMLQVTPDLEAVLVDRKWHVMTIRIALKGDVNYLYEVSF